MEEQLESYLRTHENVHSDELAGARGGKQSKADAMRNELAQQAAVSRLELDRQARAMSQELAADATGRRISLVQAARAQTAGRGAGSSEAPLREEDEDGL